MFFFRIYVNLWDTVIKDLFFIVCLFFLLTITGRNEAIIVELKEFFCFEWHFYHLFWGFPSLDLLQLRKIMPALALNFMIAATNTWRGKWNRHAVAPSDNFFTHCHFYDFEKKCKKMKIDYVHCPMRKFWRTSSRPFGQNNVGIFGGYAQISNCYVHVVYLLLLLYSSAIFWSFYNLAQILI